MDFWRSLLLHFLPQIFTFFFLFQNQLVLAATFQNLLSLKMTSAIIVAFTNNPYPPSHFPLHCWIPRNSVTCLIFDVFPMVKVSLKIFLLLARNVHCEPFEAGISFDLQLKLNSCKSRSMWQKWFNFNSLIRSLFIKSTLKWMVGWRFLFRFNLFQEECCAGSACQCTNWNRLEPIWNLKESAEICLKIHLKWFRAHIRKLRKNRFFDHGRIF